MAAQWPPSLTIGAILGLQWGYIEIMEKKMETTIIQGLCRGYIRVMQGVYRGCIGLYWGWAFLSRAPPALEPRQSSFPSKVKHAYALPGGLGIRA